MFCISFAKCLRENIFLQTLRKASVKMFAIVHLYSAIYVGPSGLTHSFYNSQLCQQQQSCLGGLQRDSGTLGKLPGSKFLPQSVRKQLPVIRRLAQPHLLLQSGRNSVAFGTAPFALCTIAI